MSQSEVAVSVRGLCKSYTIAHDHERHATLAEAILFKLKNPLRRPSKETFWALKDVDFEIKKGEVIGIIGRNGAGKSTLLKVLSQITQPTSGEVDIYGRIGSLLEVGTGFHPELTGRENVYLNGAILGMTTAEIRSQFDAIVDFAGVEQFLDTPVKRYSSGMYVRLAFAVAAHLNPEILIIDEVLAVGDAAFQEKCLGKMKDVASHGRTVLFVSHNTSAVRQLCTSCIYLERGSVKFQGDVSEAINAYTQVPEIQHLAGISDKLGRGALSVEALEVRVGEVPVDSVASGDNVELAIRLRVNEPLRGPLKVGVALESPQFGFVIINYSQFQSVSFASVSGTCRALMRRLPVAPGQYQVHLRILCGEEEIFWSTHAMTLHVHAGDFFQTGARGETGLCPWLYAMQWTFEESEIVPRGGNAPSAA